MSRLAATVLATALLTSALFACGSNTPVNKEAKAPVTEEPKTEPAAAATTPATPSAPASAEPGVGTTATTSATNPPKRIGARHVLVQYMGSERAPSAVVRTREQARSVADEVLKRARAGEDLARLAVEYSDEPGAGGRGGSLGRFGKGQMVGAFEEIAFKLKVGEISDVVETPFGFHVIQRTE